MLHYHLLLATLALITVSRPMTAFPLPDAGGLPSAADLDHITSSLSDPSAVPSKTISSDTTPGPGVATPLTSTGFSAALPPPSEEKAAPAPRAASKEEETVEEETAPPSKRQSTFIEPKSKPKPKSNSKANDFGELDEDDIFGDKGDDDLFGDGENDDLFDDIPPKKKSKTTSAKTAPATEQPEKEISPATSATSATPETPAAPALPQLPPGFLEALMKLASANPATTAPAAPVAPATPAVPAAPAAPLETWPIIPSSTEVKQPLPLVLYARPHSNMTGTERLATEQDQAHRLVRIVNFFRDTGERYTFRAKNVRGVVERHGPTAPFIVHTTQQVVRYAAPLFHQQTTEDAKHFQRYVEKCSPDLSDEQGRRIIGDYNTPIYAKFHFDRFVIRILCDDGIDLKGDLS